MKIIVLEESYYLSQELNVVGIFSSIEKAKEMIFNRYLKWDFVKASDFGHQFSIKEVEVDTNKQTELWHGYTVGTFFQNPGKTLEDEKRENFHYGEELLVCTALK